MAINYSENISVFGASADNTIKLHFNTNSSEGGYNSQTGLYKNNLYATIEFEVEPITPGNVVLNSNCHGTFEGLSNARFNLTNMAKRMEYDTTIKDASNMFAFDYNVTGNAFIPLLANNLSHMYHSCLKLTGIQNTNSTYSYADDVSYFMSGCENMSTEFPKFPRATNLSHAFMNLKHLYNVGKIGNNVKNLQSAFVGTNLSGVSNVFSEVIIGNNVTDMTDAFFNAKGIWGVTTGPNVHTISYSFSGAQFYGFDWKNFYATNLWIASHAFEAANFSSTLYNSQNGGYYPKYITIDFSKATQLQSMSNFMADATFNRADSFNVYFPTVWLNSSLLYELSYAFYLNCDFKSSFTLVLQHCTNTVSFNYLFRLNMKNTNKRIVLGNMDTFNHFISNGGSLVGEYYLRNLIWTNATHYINVPFYHINGVLANYVNLRLYNTAYNEYYKILISYSPDLDALSINSNLGVK